MEVTEWLRENGITSLEDMVKVLNQSHDGIILADNNGKIFFANDEAILRLANMHAGSIVGQTSRELISKGVVLEESKTKISYEGNQGVVLINQKLKTGVETLITSVPVYRSESDTKPFCYIANYREITDLNNLRKELEEAKNKTKSYLCELAELRKRFLQENQVVAHSSIMRSMLDKLAKISATDVNVYLYGESGVGKEVFALLIHKMSSRKDGPFIQINCGAIPENLLESELFGYEKGAFTSANRLGKLGILEMAQNGTVLLDEIGDLSLSLQVKLLKAIQNHEFYRLGGIKPVKMDIRIICATNKDLEEMVKTGKFREDLYYRINVIPIFIPPLRKRREDILPLAFHFLRKYKQKYDLERSFSQEACNALEQYDWPGNVRELENIVERLVIMNEENRINLQNLPAHITGSYGNNEINETKPLKKAVAQLERKMISEAVNKYGSIRKAAEKLGLDHSTLVKKLKKYSQPVD